MEQFSAAKKTAIVRSYSEAARELLKDISVAKREIYLASRFFEPMIGNKLLSKFAEGLSIHILDGNSSGVSFEERIRAASVHDSKNRDLMLKMLDTPDIIIQTNILSYSFSVFDGKHCDVELTNPANPDDFYCAIKMEDSELAKGLIEMFNDLVKSAKPREKEIARYA